MFTSTAFGGLRNAPRNKFKEVVAEIRKRDFELWYMRTKARDALGIVNLNCRTKCSPKEFLRAIKEADLQVLEKEETRQSTSRLPSLCWSVGDAREAVESLRVEIKGVSTRTCRCNCIDAVPLQPISSYNLNSDLHVWSSK